MRLRAKDINHNYPYTWDDSAKYDYSNADIASMVLDYSYKSVLILGAHTNKAIHNWARKCPKTQFTVVDMNKKHINNLKKLRRLPNLEIVKSKFSSFYSKKSYELMYCHGVYSYIPDEEVSAIHRLMHCNISKQILLSYELATANNHWITLRQFAKRIAEEEGYRPRGVTMFVSRAKNYFKDSDPEVMSYIDWLEHDPVSILDTIYQPIYNLNRSTHIHRMMYSMGFAHTIRRDDLNTVRLELWSK